MFKRKYYWDRVSNQISILFRRHFTKDMTIFEIGFGGGHFLEWLFFHGYRNISGIEVRESQYNETAQSFKSKKINVNLISGDIFNYSQKYDAIYSTGLIQCLDDSQRVKFFEHVSLMANLAIFTVPEILVERNVNSNQLVAVDGCKEYRTGNIPFELSKFYDVVTVGRVDKNLIKEESSLVYYICKKNV